MTQRAATHGVAHGHSHGGARAHHANHTHHAHGGKITRFYDPRWRVMAVRIEAGEHYVTDDNGEMIVTVLGSCIAACIRDPVAGVGGMNHFMLPDGGNSPRDPVSAGMLYGSVAMEWLINDILSRGGQRQRLEVKVFGGATMIGRGGQVGPRNADFVERYLDAEKLPIAARCLRGDHARRVHYFPGTGRARMMLLRPVDQQLIAMEAEYRETLRTRPQEGGVELF